MFTCQSHTEVHWHFNNGRLPFNAYPLKEGYNNTLFIYGVTPYESGIYGCDGRDPETGSFYTSQGTLTVLGR